MFKNQETWPACHQSKEKKNLNGKGISKNTMEKITIEQNQPPVTSKHLARL